MRGNDQKAIQRERIAEFTSAADKSVSTLLGRLWESPQARMTLSPEESRDAVRNAAVTALVRFMLEGEGTSSATVSRIMLELRPIVEGAVAIVKSERTNADQS